MRVSSGCPGEADPHHVVDFALLEVGPAIHVIERRDFALAFGFGGSNPQLDHRPGFGGAVELVVDLDAVFVVNALKAGEIIILDRVLVAEEEGDVDQLVGL